MIEMPGKNRFKGWFDWFEWSAPIYETPEEVILGFRELGVMGKRIVHVRAIGAASDFGLESWKESARYALWDAGISRSGIEHIQNYEDCRIRNCAQLYEPIVFTFVDGTTFEFMPQNDGMVRMSVNTIPQDIHDGLNNSNIDLMQSVATNCLGFTMDNIKIYRKFDICSEFDHGLKKISHCSNSISAKYVLECDETELSFILDQCENSFSIYMQNNPLTDPDMVEIKNIFPSRKPVSQKFLCPYSNNVGLNIFPCNMTKNGKLAKFLENNIFISIEDCDESMLFYNYLNKYYDDAIQLDDKLSRGNYEYYDDNYFTYESMKKIILEIRNDNRNALLFPYEKNTLDNLKSFCCPSDETDFYKPWHADLDEEMRFARALHMMVDYRERFCRHMEGLMRISGNGLFCFSGP